MSFDRAARGGGVQDLLKSAREASAVFDPSGGGEASDAAHPHQPRSLLVAPKSGVTSVAALVPHSLPSIETPSATGDGNTNKNNKKNRTSIDGALKQLEAQALGEKADDDQQETEDGSSVVNTARHRNNNNKRARSKAPVITLGEMVRKYDFRSLDRFAMPFLVERLDQANKAKPMSEIALEGNPHHRAILHPTVSRAPSSILAAQDVLLPEDSPMRRRAAPPHGTPRVAAYFPVQGNFPEQPPADLSHLIVPSEDLARHLFGTVMRSGLVSNGIAQDAVRMLWPGFDDSLLVDSSFEVTARKREGTKRHKAGGLRFEGFYPMLRCTAFLNNMRPLFKLLGRDVTDKFSKDEFINQIAPQLKLKDPAQTFADIDAENTGSVGVNDFAYFLAENPSKFGDLEIVPLMALTDKQKKRKSALDRLNKEHKTELEVSANVQPSPPTNNNSDNSPSPAPTRRVPAPPPPPQTSRSAPTAAAVAVGGLVTPSSGGRTPSAGGRPPMDAPAKTARHMRVQARREANERARQEKLLAQQEESDRRFKELKEREEEAERQRLEALRRAALAQRDAILEKQRREAAEEEARLAALREEEDAARKAREAAEEKRRAAQAKAQAERDAMILSLKERDAAAKKLAEEETRKRREEDERNRMSREAAAEERRRQAAKEKADKEEAARLKAEREVQLAQERAEEEKRKREAAAAARAERAAAVAKAKAEKEAAEKAAREEAEAKKAQEEKERREKLAQERAAREAKAKQEAARRKKEAEEAKLAEEEKKKAAEEAKRKAAEERQLEAARIAAERKRKAEEDAEKKRLAAIEAAERKKAEDEEAARQKAEKEAEAARRKAEEEAEAARKKAEEEEAERKRKEEEEAEAKRKEEEAAELEETRSLAHEIAEQKRKEEEEARRKAEEQAAAEAAEAAAAAKLAAEYDDEKERKMKEREAATTIQCAARKHQAKKQLVARKAEHEQEEQAATKIQCAQRQHHAKRELDQLKAEKKKAEEEEEAAAEAARKKAQEEEEAEAARKKAEEEAAAEAARKKAQEEEEAAASAAAADAARKAAAEKAMADAKAKAEAEAEAKRKAEEEAKRRAEEAAREKERQRRQAIIDKYAKPLPTVLPHHLIMPTEKKTYSEIFELERNFRDEKTPGGGGGMTEQEFMKAVDRIWPGHKSSGNATRSFSYATKDAKSCIPTVEEFTNALQFIVYTTNMRPLFENVDANGVGTINQEDFDMCAGQFEIADAVKGFNDMKKFISDSLDIDLSKGGEGGGGGGSDVPFDLFCFFLSRVKPFYDVEVEVEEANIPESNNKGGGAEESKEASFEVDRKRRPWKKQPAPADLEHVELPPDSDLIQDLWDHMSDLAYQKTKDNKARDTMDFESFCQACAEMWPGFDNTPAMKSAFECVTFNPDDAVHHLPTMAHSKFTRALQYVVYANNLSGLFDDEDENGVKKVAKDEFVQIAAQFNVKSPSKAFDAMDHNKNGFISFDAFCEWVTINKDDIEHTGESPKIGNAPDI